MIIDVATVRSLADLFRREQSVGHCLDPDQAAATAVTHLMALGYRGPRPRPDLVAPAHLVPVPVPVSEPLPAIPVTTTPSSPSPIPHARDAAAPAASNSMERVELSDPPGDDPLTTSPAELAPARPDRQVPALHR